MWTARLAPDVPRIATHYAGRQPFGSLMALDPAARAAVLAAGGVWGAARYQDPTYVETRSVVESALYAEFQAVGGEPRIRHPHYALIGRSARREAAFGPEDRACVLELDRLPPRQVSFTWGDSFYRDPAFRRLRGGGHPAFGQTFDLHDLPEVLERYAAATDRPAWQEIELQLWFQPEPGDYRTLRPAPAPG